MNQLTKLVALTVFLGVLYVGEKRVSAGWYEGAMCAIYCAQQVSGLSDSEQALQAVGCTTNGTGEPSWMFQQLVAQCVYLTCGENEQCLQDTMEGAFDTCFGGH